MNGRDRKQLSDLIALLEALYADFQSVKEDIQTLAEAEREKYDNMPEGLQQSERGAAIDAAATELESAADADSIEETLDALNNIE